MDETLWTLMTIIGPAILLAAIVWVAIRSRRSNRPEDVARSEKATHDLYEEEEERRREGIDGL